jgi:hypothetical protein
MGEVVLVRIARVLGPQLLVVPVLTAGNRHQRAPKRDQILGHWRVRDGDKREVADDVIEDGERLASVVDEYRDGRGQAVPAVPCGGTPDGGSVATGKRHLLPSNGSQIRSL